jgi:GrpB-like predicted nucleotidyltransferase (UPF0157 family)
VANQSSSRVSTTTPTAVFPVALVGYDPNWPIAFHEEALRLLKATKGQLLSVDHIGSTSVAGLAAKPTIDMLAELNQVELDSAPLVPLLEPLGYHDRSAEFSDRILFSDGRSGARTRNLHIVAKGTASLRNEILFRDRLRRDHKVATAYEALKRALAKRQYHDPYGYSRAKSDFVVAIIDEERAARGLPPVDIWATLGPLRQKGWLEIERSSPPGGPI